MASIDYQEARKEILKIFTTADSDERKIVFWYDAPANFREDIENDSFDCCRLLVCKGNEFQIKKIIEHDDLLSNFLVYIPSEKPIDNDNWLLDMVCYGEEYYADTVALTMRRLGLANADLRRVIERYSKFFDAESRTKRLNSYIEVNDNMNSSDLKMAMMAVIVKASARSIESVLTELVFDNSEGSKYSELLKFGFEEYLWDEIAQYYNYSGDQKLDSLVKRFVFTAFLEQKAEFDSIPSFYRQYEIEGAGKMDAKFFVDRIKSDKRYDSLQLGLAVDLKIEELLVSREISCVQTADVFECVDNYIIKKIAESLANGSLDYENFEKNISCRLNSMWYEKHQEEYELLSATMAFLRCIEVIIPTNLSATDLIKEYTESFYLIDTYYRRICVNYKKIELPIPAVDELMNRIEGLYQTKFLDCLGKEYSDAVKDQKDWQFTGIDMTSDFYRNIERKNYKKCIVIISDGFRYELGHELYERIKIDSILKGCESISYAISPLPSETRFGMASLLPHQTISYANKSVYVDSKITNSTDARNAILNSRSSSYSAITYDEIYNMSRGDLRAYMSDKSLVYVYHNVVDDAGEHNEGRVFDVCQTAIDDILLLIRKLYNGLQISNFYVTADHGFMYRRNKVEESMKYSNILSQHPIEASKRYVIAENDSVDIPYTLDFLIENQNGVDYRVITPYGYDLFKTQGGGLQYIHGGASLQETVVPIIRISELSSAKNKESLSAVGVRLKSINRKITNRSFTLEFEQYEKVEERKQAVTCETYLVDEDGNDVSGRYKFVAASESDDIKSRITKIRFNLDNKSFDRNRRYYLILKNIEKADEYLEKEQFTIDILNLKMF